MAHLSIIQDLNNTELKYTLISDLCLFARADEDFSDEEYAYIVDIAGYLGVTPEQVSAIRTVQKNVQKIKNIPSRSLRTKNILKESAVHLAQMGVPVAAIAASGSVFGLSAAGITSGLAALGALVGGGMLAGTVFVVPAIAAGSAFGVKKLFDVVWKDRKPIEQKSEKIPAKRKNNEQTSPAQS